MRAYESVNDLPFVYRYNLPPTALELFREVYNQTWKQTASRRDRDVIARQRAITAVKARFTRDRFGVWREKQETGVVRSEGFEPPTPSV